MVARVCHAECLAVDDVVAAEDGYGGGRGAGGQGFEDSGAPR